MHIKTEDIEIHSLGFGTYQITGEACKNAVADAIAIGYRHIDTAQMYENEEVVGRGIKASGIDREDLFITTKVWYTDLQKNKVLQNTAESLRKLQTDYIDLLLIHWPAKDIPLEETFDAMMQLKAHGKIRHIGVSNFTVPLLQKAINIASIVCNQVEHHPYLDQTPVLDFVRAHQMFLTSYCPVAKGRVMEDDLLKEIGNTYGKNPAQVTLRWLIQLEKVAAIPKASKHDHRAQNFDVFDFQLTEAEMHNISALQGDNRLINPSWAPQWDREIKPEY
jgi:diketogulonate reductase-like aldo/keto reductase